MLSDYSWKSVRPRLEADVKSSRCSLIINALPNLCVIPCRYSGVLSAYGLALADVVEELQEPCSLQYEQNSFKELDWRIERLTKRCQAALRARQFTRSASTEQ